MDPLSLTASITGLMAFAASVSVLVVNTIRTVKNAKANLITLAGELESFRSVLDAVNNEVRRQERVGDQWRKLLVVVIGNSFGCLTELERMISLTQGRRAVEIDGTSSRDGGAGPATTTLSTKWNNFRKKKWIVGGKYMFKEDAILGLNNRLDRCRDMLAVVLAGITAESGFRIEDRMDELQRMVGQLLQQASPPAYEETLVMPLSVNEAVVEDTQESGFFAYAYEALSAWIAPAEVEEEGAPLRLTESPDVFTDKKLNYGDKKENEQQQVFADKKLSYGDKKEYEQQQVSTDNYTEPKTYGCERALSEPQQQIQHVLSNPSVQHLARPSPKPRSMSEQVTTSKPRANVGNSNKDRASSNAYNALPVDKYIKSKAEQALCLYPNFETQFAHQLTLSKDKNNEWSQVSQRSEHTTKRPSLGPDTSDSASIGYALRQEQVPVEGTNDPSDWLDKVCERRTKRVCIEEARQLSDMKTEEERSIISFSLDGNGGNPTEICLWLDQKTYQARLAWYGPQDPNQKFPSWKTFILNPDPSVKFLQSYGVSHPGERILKWTLSTGARSTQKFMFPSSQAAEQFSQYLESAAFVMQTIIRGELPPLLPYMESPLPHENVVHYCKNVNIRFTSVSSDSGPFSVAFITHEVPDTASRIVVFDKQGKHVLRIIVPHYLNDGAPFTIRPLNHRPGRYKRISARSSTAWYVIHVMVNGGPSFAPGKLDGAGIWFGEWRNNSDEVAFDEVIRAMNIAESMKSASTSEF